MKWEDRGQSGDVHDNRGRGGSVSGMGMGSLGIGGFLILLVLSLVFGVDLFSMLGMDSPLGGGSTTTPQTQSAPQQSSAADKEMLSYLSAILDDNQNMWRTIFADSKVPYEKTQLNVEDDVAESACGMVPASAGPFYCPNDGMIYLSPSFFDELKNRFGAPGDFAQAYVVAHEVGHHIQHLLGTAQQVRQLQQQNPAQANRYQVALELQADCYAGVWGSDQTSSRVSQITEEDFYEAMRAASAIGDDKIQQQTRGYVDPEGFTHGSSKQRQEWFSRGFESGDPNQCDTLKSI